MRIALVGPANPYRGGVAQHTTVLWKYLVKHHDVRFISFSRQYPSLIFPGSSDKEPGTVRKLGRCRYIIDTINPATWAAAARDIIGFRPHVLVFVWWVPFFAFCWRSIAYLVKRSADVPVVFVCHNVLPHENNPVWNRISSWALRCAGAFTVHSRSDHDILHAMMPGRSVVTLPIAPHPEPKIQGLSRKEARSALGLKEENTVFLFFGFVRQYKGLDILLQALDHVKDKDACLLVAGEFWNGRARYETMIQKMGLEHRVVIIDRYIADDEFETYFAASDAVVLPYRDATQSGVPQLSFAMGRPVIVTDVGGLSENIPTPAHGIVVPPANPEKLAEAMDVLARTLGEFDQSFLKKHAAERTEKDWMRMVQAIETLGGTDE